MSAAFWLMVGVVATAGVTFVTIIIWLETRLKGEGYVWSPEIRDELRLIGRALSAETHGRNRNRKPAKAG